MNKIYIIIHQDAIISNMNTETDQLRILFVEDSPIDAAIIEHELKSSLPPFISKRVETPEAFTEVLQNEYWDVIFSDYSMPRFSALAALEILQQSKLDIPFIIISGSIGEDIAVEALHKGADDYLMKDNLARLIPALERELLEVSERHARKKVEALLTETENSYRRLVEGIKDYGIFMIDSGGQVLTWNIGAERILGYSADEIIGHSFSCFFLPELLEQGLPTKEIEVATSKGSYEAEMLLIRKDGSTFSAHNVLTAVYTEQGVLTGFSKTVKDITERKLVEEYNKRLTDEMEQRVAERTAELALVNQELESFIHSVSHDLRSPLRNLVRLSKILANYGEMLNAEGQQYLGFIVDSSQQALLLINALLDLSRVNRSQLKKHTVDLSTIAKEIAEELKHSEPERQVEFLIAPKMVVEGDPILLRITLQNLLENAWKYTSKISPAIIEFFSKEDQGKTIFSIKDNGVGFDPAYSNKLFQAFQRLHPNGEFPGNGIGLATVQRVIHRHGGHIWAEASVGKGATFSFYLAAK
jgi:PAS domain S-box-containing protein